jgi:molybdopterin/thiamine biosynthesis adenylyltransferase
LIDYGHFKMASLLTHNILPRDAALGLSKARYAGRLCKQISPRTDVRAYAGVIQSMALDALADVDLVALATDNVAAEVEAGKRCLRLRKPLIHASVHGETLIAQVRFYRNADAGGACPACFLNRMEIEYLNSGAAFPCDGSGAPQPSMGGRTGPPTAKAGGVPTRSTSCLCNLAADLAVVEILKFVLELGPKRGDFVLEYAGYTNRTVVTPLGPRKSTCPCDHDTVWGRASPPRPLAECSLAELAAAAGFNSGLQRVAFTVDHLVFAVAGICACGKRRRVERFVAPGASAPRACEVCRRPVHPEGFFSRRPVAADDLGDAVHRPLRELGAEAPRSVLVAEDQRAVLFTDSAARGAAGQAT